MYSKWLFGVSLIIFVYGCSCESETIPVAPLEISTSKSAEIPEQPEKENSEKVPDKPSEEKSGEQIVSESIQISVDKEKRSGENDGISDVPVEEKLNEKSNEHITEPVHNSEVEKTKELKKDDQILEQSSEGMTENGKSVEPSIQSEEIDKKIGENVMDGILPSLDESQEPKNPKILESEKMSDLTVEEKTVEPTEIKNADKLKEETDDSRETTTSSSADFTTIMAETSKMNCPVSNDTDFSWLVKIIDKDTGKQVCTGTLITDEDVLVPASCFLENSTSPVADNFYDIPEQIYAIAGGGIGSDCMQIRNVTAIYPHKAYLTDVDGMHDYAYLKVKPVFDVDDGNPPDLRYHTTVLSSEGGLVDIHNRSPFCESPFFLDDAINARVSEERYLLGMRIEECMGRWNCSANFDGCLDFLHPSTHSCLKALAPRNCTAKDRGAPLICSSVFLGFLDICDGELPLIFRGLSKAIKFLELEDNHVQPPGYYGVGY